MPVTPSRTRVLRRWLARARSEERGVAAVEFAIIAPIMIVCYLGMTEVCQALMADRRTAHTASSVGDLTAQYGQITDATIQDIFSVSKVIVRPFPIATLKMRMTSITGDAKIIGHVDWSQVPNGQGGLTPYADGALYTSLPAGLINNPGDSVIMAESYYTYTSPFAYILKTGIPMKQVYYLRPRKSSTITCTVAATGKPC